MALIKLTRRIKMEYRVIELLKEIKGLLTNGIEEDKWIDIKKASQYCGISTSTIRRNIKDKKLKASSRTGKLLFKQSELENWLSN
jgi:excisionase family DNA binding protein